MADDTGALSHPLIPPPQDVGLYVLDMLRAGLTPEQMIREGRIRVPLVDLTRMCRTLQRQRVRDIVTPHILEMIAAQVANAKGLSYLVYRDEETGKFERVRDVTEVDQDQVTIEVWQKDPSVQAFTDLMNRAIDKPQEHVEITGQDGGPVQLEVVSRLAAARKRLAEEP